MKHTKPPTFIYATTWRRHTAPPRRIRPSRRRLVLGMVAGVSVLFLGAHILQAVQSARAAGPHYTKVQTVCIDPGHGGSDPGAVTTDGVISERDINLTVALRVRSLLQTAGYQVFMTRTTNSPTLSNHDRYTYCNARHATIMVSIHHNFFTDSTVDYATALYYKDTDQALATSILNSVASTLSVPNDNISQFNDGVLSESHMPAALSEGFFITSDGEYQQLTAPGSTRLSLEATGITKGIEQYFAAPHATQPSVSGTPQVIVRDDSAQ